MGGGLSPDNQTLMGYITPALANWVYWMLLPHLHHKGTNKGLTVKFSDNSESAGVRELEYYRRALKDNAQSYMNRLLKFLNENKSTYPLYESFVSGSCEDNGCKTDFGLYIPE